MARPAQYLGGDADFTETAPIHDSDTIGYLRDNREIV